MKTFPAFGTKSSFDVLPLFFAGALSTGSGTASSVVVFGAIFSKFNYNFCETGLGFAMVTDWLCRRREIVRWV